jgi:hypothetical protein
LVTATGFVAATTAAAAAAQEARPAELVAAPGARVEQAGGAGWVV